MPERSSHLPVWMNNLSLSCSFLSLSTKPRRVRRCSAPPVASLTRFLIAALRQEEDLYLTQREGPPFPQGQLHPSVIFITLPFDTYVVK